MNMPRWCPDRSPCTTTHEFPAGREEAVTLGAQRGPAQPLTGATRSPACARAERDGRATTSTTMFVPDDAGQVFVRSADRNSADVGLGESFRHVDDRVRRPQIFHAVGHDVRTLVVGTSLAGMPLGGPYPKRFGPNSDAARGKDLLLRHRRVQNAPESNDSE